MGLPEPTRDLAETPLGLAAFPVMAAQSAVPTPARVVGMFGPEPMVLIDPEEGLAGRCGCDECECAGAKSLLDVGLPDTKQWFGNSAISQGAQRSSARSGYSIMERPLTAPSAFPTPRLLSALAASASPHSAAPALARLPRVLIQAAVAASAEFALDSQRIAAPTAIGATPAHVSAAATVRSSRLAPQFALEKPSVTLEPVRESMRAARRSTQKSQWQPAHLLDGSSDLQTTLLPPRTSDSRQQWGIAPRKIDFHRNDVNRSRPPNPPSTIGGRQ